MSAAGIGKAVRSYLAAMRRYAGTSGRSSRLQYWVLVVAFWSAPAMTAAIDEFTADGAPDAAVYAAGAWALLHFPALVATGVRRLHDTDRSGSWMLTTAAPFGGLVLFRLYCLPGTEGPNRFGPEPQA